MKIVVKHYLAILVIFFLTQSCFQDLGKNKFTSFQLYLYNNSSQSGCISDSLNVTFVIRNADNINSKEVRINVLARDQKNANIEGTRNESIDVKLLNSADGTTILEEKIKIGENVYAGGDLMTRKISYCDNKAFALKGFAH